MLAIAEVLAFFWGSLLPVVSHTHRGAFTEQAEFILCVLGSAYLRQFFLVVCKHDFAIMADVRWEMWKGFWGLFVLMVFFYALSLMGLPHGKKTLIWQRRETHVMAQNSYWISKLHDSKENCPSCCHSNWDFALFFFLPESGLECICFAVGGSRKPQSNPDSPPIEINWQNSRWLHWGQKKAVNGQGEVIWCFWLLRFCPPSVPLYFSSIWCCRLQCEYDHINVNRVPKSNTAHCLAWDLIKKAFCDSRQLILLVKSYPR